jgi:hypothetical protein
MSSNAPIRRADFGPAERHRGRRRWLLRRLEYVDAAVESLQRAACIDNRPSARKVLAALTVERALLLKNLAREL